MKRYMREAKAQGADLICIVNCHQIAQFQKILARFPGSSAYVLGVNKTVESFKHIA